MGGSGLTQGQLNSAASTIRSTINSAWSGTYVQDGITYTVTTNVNVTVATTEIAGRHSGAQNLIALTNGNASATANSVVEFKSLLGGPDRGTWNINSLGLVSGHEFTHLLGVDDRHQGTDLSNTNLLNNPSISHIATSNDFRWAFGGEISSHRNSLRTAEDYGMRLRPTGPPGSGSSTTTVGTPYFWWK